MVLVGNKTDLHVDRYLDPLYYYYTLEPHYVDLDYIKLPSISNRIGFLLDLPLFFQSLKLRN